MSKSNSRPPPIPPNRRFSQPIHQINQNSSNSIEYPAVSSSLQPRYLTNALSGGIRQSITFHGQSDYSNSNSYENNTVNMKNTLLRKANRPVSFAYGTLPEQNYLENQLRMYSEQLQLITESVRKYSEQAKILSDVKRKQQLRKNQQLELSSPQEGSTLSITKTDDMIPSPRNLRLHLDNVCNKTNEIEQPGTHLTTSSSNSSSSTSQRKEPRLDTNQNVCISTKTITEAKTPSDQLRQFLDAIRSNQLPEEDQSNLSSAADLFSKFKVKMKNSRSKSTPNFNEYQTRTNKNESSTNFSKNLLIMNKDLEIMTKVSPQIDVHIQKGSRNIFEEKDEDRMDFDKILDKFFEITNMETVEYLRKCSHILKRSTNQENINNPLPYTNPFLDTTNCSYYSNIPGSTHYAVPNKLQQPRNNVEIMIDRMKLFIDILDIQSKFSKVNLQSH